MTGRKVFRFGVFELDSRTGELRKHGVKLRLRGKPLQILARVFGGGSSTSMSHTSGNQSAERPANFR